MSLVAALGRRVARLPLALLAGGLALAGLLPAIASAFGGSAGSPAMPGIETGGAIAARPLTNGSIQNADGEAAAVTAPVTIGAGKLALAWVAQSDGAGGVPTVTDSLRQWEVVASTVATSQRLTLYRSMGANETYGAVTITPSSATALTWTLVEYSNVNAGGTNGAGAIAQFESTNFKASGVGMTTYARSVLTPAHASGSATVSGFAVDSTARSPKPGKGFAFTGDRSCSVVCAQAEFKGKFARLADLSWTNDSYWLVITAELKRR